jgi:hypothetical protein
MRHFLFVVPPLTCLAGISLAVILDYLSGWNTKAGVAAIVLVSVSLLYQVLVMARLHPYEYIFYNRLAGGVEQAYRSYETDYWGTATSEAARWLVQSLEESGHGPGEKIKVYIAGANEFSAKYYFPEWVEITPILKQADYLIGGIRNFSWEQLPGEELYAVTRLGIPLKESAGQGFGSDARRFDLLVGVESLDGSMQSIRFKSDTFQRLLQAGEGARRIDEEIAG